MVVKKIGTMAACSTESPKGTAATTNSSSEQKEVDEDLDDEIFFFLSSKGELLINGYRH